MGEVARESHPYNSNASLLLENVNFFFFFSLTSETIM